MAKTKDTIRTEALSKIGDLRRAGVDISMGVGKTLTALTHMAMNYTSTRKFMVVAPRKKIFDSWLEDMEEFGLNYLKDHITFVTYRSLIKHSHDYDQIYLDECQSLKAVHNVWLRDYIAQGGRTLGLTGTYPIRKTTEKGKMCNFYCPKVYTYTPDEGVKDKILNDYKIIVHELKLDTVQNIVKNGPHGEWKTSEMKDYMYWTRKIDECNSPKEEAILRIQRMKALQKFSTKLIYAKHLFASCNNKTLLFANTQKQADDLCTHSFHNKNKASETNLTAFKKGDIMKLTAVEQLNEGVTIPGLKIGIILHAYANNRKAAQKIGRLLRLAPEDQSLIHILCYANSIDKAWVKEALSTFDQSKISWVPAVNYAGGV